MKFVTIYEYIVTEDWRKRNQRKPILHNIEIDE